MTLAQAAARAAQVRAGGGRVVTVNGCFDVLHPGHLATLAAARSLGDCLLVLVNDDASVARLKGPARPVLPAEARIAVLEALRDVDGAVAFGEDTPLAALATLRPHVHAKGGTYLPERVAEERRLMEGWGGRVEMLPLSPGWSTTGLLARARGEAP